MAIHILDAMGREGFEQVIARCHAKIANLDGKLEKYERKIVEMRHEIERVKRVQAIAKGG